MASETTLEELIYWFDSFEEATRDARVLAERDRDYYDHNQWTQDEVAILKERGQPIITINRIAPKIDYLLGYERRSRSVARALPRNAPMDEKSSQAAQDSIRFVCDQQNWQRKRSYAWQDILVGGAAGVEVCTYKYREDDEYMQGQDPEVRIEYLSWDRIVWDPRSYMTDFSDARYKGTVIWMDMEEALEIWPDSEDVFESTASHFSANTFGDTFDDKPNRVAWSDSTQKRPRIRIVQMYWRNRIDPYAPWYTATYTFGGIIEPVKLSPYTTTCNGKKIPTCPLIFSSAKVDRDNQRYGIVRGLIGPQDEINKRRSKALHLLNLRQTLGEKGSVDDVERMRQEMARPDGHVVVNPDKRFEVLNTNDMIAGQFQLLADAKAEIDAIGANAALTGRDQRAQSGRAVLARQQGGIIELESVFDSLRQMNLEVYRAIWDRIQQFWTSERWIRITDDPNNIRHIQINRPITQYEAMLTQGIPLPPIEAMDPATQAQMLTPVAFENRPAQLDVDIILDETPDVATLQEEEFAAMANLAASGLPIPPDILIEMSSIRNKEQILERLRGPSDPQAQQQQAQLQAAQQQMQLQAMQLDLEQKQADVEKTRSDSQKNHTSAAKDMADIVEKTKTPEEMIFGNSPTGQSGQ